MDRKEKVDITISKLKEQFDIPDWQERQIRFILMNSEYGKAGRNIPKDHGRSILSRRGQ